MIGRRNALIAIHYPVFGGPHNRVLRLNEALARRGWRSIALLPDDPGDALRRLREGGVEVIQIPLRRLRESRDPRIHITFGLSFAGDVARIRREIRANHVDLVVVGGLANPHAAIAAHAEDVPVVWQIVDSRTPRALHLVLMPLVNRLADALMFGGNALASLHLDGRSSAVPWFVCSPPVDLERFTSSSERRRITRDLLKIPEDAAVVGTVATLAPQKGVEYFVQAASLIYRSNRNAWFIVVGARHDAHRRYIARLEAEVLRSGIPSSRFLFVGARDDVENYYPAMDVKLITSVPRSEGTTTTAMEAMACEVPVVAADVGAVSEVVEDNRTGFLVPPQDAAALAKKTLELLAHPRLRSHLSAVGRRRVQRFSVEACADRYLEIFENAIEHRRARRPRSLLRRLT